MAIKSFASGPVWRQLGYSSPQEYLLAVEKQNNGVAPTTKKENPLKRYAAVVETDAVKRPMTEVINDFITPTPTLPQKDSTLTGKHILDNATDISTVGGNRGGGNNYGGVTNETFVKGSTSDVNPEYIPPEPSEDSTQDGSPEPANTQAKDWEYNGTGNFLEAFKAVYGYDYGGEPLTRKAGISDGVWNVLQRLYGAYQQKVRDDASLIENIEGESKYYDGRLSSLQESYDSSRQALGENKNKAQQNASISLDKLLKYLPAQARAQGYEGVGMSESSALQAYADYNNNMGTIAGDYGAQMTSLDAEKRAAEGNIEDKRKVAIENLKDKYEMYAKERDDKAGTEAQGEWSKYIEAQKAEEERLREEAGDKETEMYENFRDAILISTSTNYEELVSQIDALDTNDNYKQLLKNLAWAKVTGNIKAEEERDSAEDRDESSYLFNAVADAVQSKILNAMDENGKIFQGKYQEIFDYINSFGNQFSEKQIAALMTGLEAEQGNVINEEEEEKKRQEAKAAESYAKSPEGILKAHMSSEEFSQVDTSTITTRRPVPLMELPWSDWHSIKINGTKYWYKKSAIGPLSTM